VLLQVLKIVLDLERLERLLEYDSEKSQLPAPSMGVPLVPLTARTSERQLLGPACVFFGHHTACDIYVSLMASLLLQADCSCKALGWWLPVVLRAESLSVLVSARACRQAQLS
jgi:hypothetical protein